MKKTLLIILVSCSALLTLPAFAETVRVPVGQQADIAKPRAGATKAAVEAQFGEPISKQGPVGEPPISSWEYADFVVYFEHDHVIHSVAKHRPQGN
ncbi:MAG TPA: hypothetical protein VL987_05635 [Cellvibrio sp.]|nr:hypothetical protein [Cellvibrio sp.]